MDIAAIKAFFMWCTIINFGLLMFTFVMVSVLGDWVYGIHSKIFSISRESFNVTLYAFLGVYKILVIVFCAVPWIALVIIG